MGKFRCPSSLTSSDRNHPSQNICSSKREYWYQVWSPEGEENGNVLFMQCHHPLYRPHLFLTNIFIYSSFLSLLLFSNLTADAAYKSSNSSLLYNMQIQIFSFIRLTNVLIHPLPLSFDDVFASATCQWSTEFCIQTKIWYIVFKSMEQVGFFSLVLLTCLM